MVKINLVIVFGCSCKLVFEKHSEFITHIFESHNKYNCKKGRKILCENHDCELCFNRSFASYYRENRWILDDNDSITPREVCRNSHKLYWFLCNICHHKFNMSPHNIILY